MLLNVLGLSNSYSELRSFSLPIRSFLLIGRDHTNACYISSRISRRNQLNRIVSGKRLIESIAREAENIEI